MRISIDIDGVLAKFEDSVNAAANLLWPGILPKDYTPNNWDYTEKLTKANWEEIWKEIKNTENFWETLNPYPQNVNDLRAFLQQYRSRDFEIYFITARAITKGNLTSIQTKKWFNKYGIFDGMFNYSAILPVKKTEDKLSLMKSLEIKFSIDDYGPTIEQCNSLPNHTAFLLDRSWNRDKNYGPRIYSLNEYFDIVTNTGAVASA